VVNPVRRIVMFLLGTVTVVVLLFGYRTSTSTSLANAPRIVIPSTATPGTATTPTTGSGSTRSTAPGSSSSRASTATRTVTGATADTQWGQVQVAITVSAGKITAVSLPQYPNNNPRDQEINAYALPILVQETLKAQSAQIDMVSGATVTSGGYLQSLQSAIDKAGL
jgi:uncharacterized protein with FMN-binding domain